MTGPDFILLTGFLGSGKTTLLADFLRLPEAADTAVIVNEAGEIGVDGVILAEGGNMPVTMLANGCVCCSLGSDLQQTVMRLLAARAAAGLADPRRIVLETSGLSKPGPILRSLALLAPLRLRVGVVATYDCMRGTDIQAFEEAAAQWAGAQTIVLTKRDLVDAAGLQRAREAVAGLNPLASLIDLEREAAARAVFSLSVAAPRRLPRLLPAEGVGAAHPRIRVLLGTLDNAVPWEELAEWLDNLAAFCGERLLRLKGVVRVSDRPDPVLVQSVGTMFSAARPFPPADTDVSSLVIIVRDLDPADLGRITPRLSMRFAARLTGPGFRECCPPVQETPTPCR